jgi:hypothetical protein
MYRQNTKINHMMNFPIITDQITCVTTTVPHRNFSHIPWENQYKYYNTFSKALSASHFDEPGKRKCTKHKENLIAAK